MQTKTSQQQRLVVWFSVCLAIACGFAPPAASAFPVAASEAVLDWTGLTFAGVDGFTIAKIAGPSYTASSHAATSLGEASHEGKVDGFDPESWGETSAVSAYSTSTGSANASASTTYGFLTASSLAAPTSVRDWHAAESEAWTGLTFRLYGSGAGSITVTVPYSLSVRSIASNANTTAASSSVHLWMSNPGPSSGWYTSDTVSCRNESCTRDGILTLSGDFTGTYTGALMGIWARAETSATASVPEPSTLLLLASGLVGLGSVAWRQHRRG